MTQATQVLMSMLGTLGFSLLFHVTGKKMVAIVAGGAVSWIAYLLVVALYENPVLGLLASTFLLGLLAEVFARVFKAPVISFLVPMWVPLIPGGDLYYTTLFLVQKMTDAFTARANLLLWEAGAIAFGIILAACISHIPYKRLLHYLKNYRRG